MKKTLILSLSIALLAGGFNSCKKGDNDPFMSLKSRKARVSGEWKVSNSEDITIQTETNPDYTSVKTTTEVYDGTTLTTTSKLKFTTSDGTFEDSDTKSEKQTRTLTFEKDGTYIVKEFYAESGTTYTTAGHWTFMGKSKEAGLKNKEAIILTLNSETSADSTGTESYTETGLYVGGVVYIDQLKNKEMIWKIDNSTTTSNNTVTKRTSTIVFTAK
jgi:hypothetical protein